MELLHIQLPPDLQPFVAKRVAEEGHRDATDYLLSLVVADQMQHEHMHSLWATPEARERLERLLEEGLQGPSEPLDMDAIRAEVRERLKSRQP